MSCIRPMHHPKFAEEGDYDESFRLDGNCSTLYKYFVELKRIGNPRNGFARLTP